jgi:hypothetical protein
MEMNIYAQIMLRTSEKWAVAILRGEHITITDGFLHLRSKEDDSTSCACVEIASFEWDGYKGHYEAILKI